MKRKGSPLAMERRRSKRMERDMTSVKVVVSNLDRVLANAFVEKKNVENVGERNQPVKKKATVMEKVEKVLEGENEEPIDDQSQERPSSPKIEYPVGSKIHVKCGFGATQTTYIAKVLDTEIEGGYRIYQIHYVGWKKRHDEWIYGELVVDKPGMDEADSPILADILNTGLNGQKSGSDVGTGTLQQDINGVAPHKERILMECHLEDLDKDPVRTVDINGEQTSPLDENQNEPDEIKSADMNYTPSENQEKCTDCDVDLSKSAMLTNMKTPERSKMFTCYVCDCGKVFITRRDLALHKRSEHTRRLGDISNALDQHSNHSDSHVCTICNLPFSDLRLLETHMKLHRSTHEKNAHQTHMKSHRSNNERNAHQCTYCDKSFTQNVSLERHLKIHTKAKSYKCPLCPMAFLMNCLLERHMNVHKVQKEFKCTLCHEAFHRKLSWKKHMRSHSEETPHKCDQCDAGFTTIKRMRKHEITHNTDTCARGKTVCCAVCGKFFQFESGLLRHMRYHNGEKLYECHLCDKAYYVRHGLKEHLRSHTGERPHVCSICKKSYYHLATYRVHLKTHTGEKHHQCSFCNKKFLRKGELRDHLITHTAGKVHKCPHCPQLFSYTTTLKRHMKSTHIKTDEGDELPYKCTDCEKCFRYKWNLQSHLVVHTGERPYGCESCPKAFGSKVTLKIHVAVAHSTEKEFQCPMCPKAFSLGMYLKTHMRIHTGERSYKCHICDKTFTTSGMLSKHVRTHSGEKNHKCSICHRGFLLGSQLKTHMKVHTGERPFNCSICLKAFTTKSIMKNHIKKIHKARSCGKN